MTGKIAHVRAIEILDSRGNPTLKVSVTLSSGITGAAAVPSGASTGENEAVELRDGDPRRYDGKGVLEAAENVNARIAPEIEGLDAHNQSKLDQMLRELDGTDNYSKLGANAVLGVSMATARAAAMEAGQSLYRYLGGAAACTLPVPMMNVLNGGKHAANSVDFQEYMIVPLGAPSFTEALRYSAETYHSLAGILRNRGYATAVGDEGGFAPNLKSNEEACELLVEAITQAGYEPGTDVAMAIDPAASSFFVQGEYDLSRSGQGRRTSEEMCRLYELWARKYPLVSIEDGLAETDWKGFEAHTASLGKKIQIVGDDIYVTNTKFIQHGIETQASNAVLIKLNQIGTVTQTIEAVELCRKAGWNFVISHRSGETEDAFIADFAVAMGGGQIKTGAPCRSERVAKYNRLLEIELELGSRAIFKNPFKISITKEQ
ncbi:MAG: phosphopyruvate hydratase [Planctomycetia bacterium]|nr:phosphopyruvate hydratase [Planctomycetia bacterium]